MVSLSLSATSLSSIPKHFLHNIFDLRQPGTFSEVTCEATNQHLSLMRSELQAKFHKLLDVVEIRLWQQISNKANVFYDSLHKISGLLLKVREVQRRLQRVKSHLLKLKQGNVEKSIKLVTQRQRLWRLEQVSLRVRAIAIVFQAEKSTLLCLGRKQPENSLDIAFGARQIIADKLSQLQCLTNIKSKFEKYDNIASSVLYQNLVHLAHKQSLFATNEGAYWADVRRKSAELVRRRKLQGALICLEKSFVDNISSVWNSVVRTYAEGYGMSNGTDGLKKYCMKALNQVQFEELLSTLIHHLVEILARASELYSNVLESALETHDSATRNGGLSKWTNLVDSTREQIHGIMIVLCENMEKTVAQVLEDRYKAHSCCLDVSDLMRMCRVTGHLISKCDSLCGWTAYKLLAAMHQLADSSFQISNERFLSLLLRVIEGDNWKICSVNASAQLTLDFLSNLGKWDVANLDINDTAESTDKAAKLIFSEQSYFAPSSLLTLLDTIAGFLRFVCVFPFLVNDVCLKLTGLLQTFNLRLKQLVLEGGSFSLKNVRSITIKHLVLCAQSLSLITSIIPSLKSFLLFYQSPKRPALLSDMEKLPEIYRNHKELIFSKCVDIVVQRIKKMAGSLKDFQWDKEVDHDEKPLSLCMKNIIEDIQTMHKTISNLLCTTELSDIFSLLVGKYSQYCYT